MLAVCITGVLCGIRGIRHSISSGIKNAVIFFALGIFSFVLGLFPYLAVGKPPALTGWESRHQLFLPLGAAFMIVSLVSLSSNIAKIPRTARIIIYSLLISGMVISHIRVYWAYHEDWYKMLSIVENLRTDDRIDPDKNRFFFMLDNTSFPDTSLTAHRPYFLWEYVGLFRMAYGRTFNIGIPAVINSQGNFVFDRSSNWKFVFRALGDMQIDPDPPVIIISDNSFHIENPIQHLRLIFEEFFFPQRFKRNIRKVVKLQIVEYPSFVNMLQSRTQ